MAIEDVTRESVIKALAEFDRVGEHTFLGDYGYTHDSAHALVVLGRAYDPLAIVGAAHGFLADGGVPLPASDLLGGAQRALRHLEALGFIVRPMSAGQLHVAPRPLLLEERLLVQWAAARCPGLKAEEQAPSRERLCQIANELPGHEDRSLLSLDDFNREVADQELVMSQEARRWPRAAEKAWDFFDSMGLARLLYRCVERGRVPPAEADRLEEERAFPLGRLAFRVHRERDRVLSQAELEPLLEAAKSERSRRWKDRWIRMLPARDWIRRQAGRFSWGRPSPEVAWNASLEAILGSSSTGPAEALRCADCGADLVALHARLGTWSIELHDELHFLRLPEEFAARGVVLCAACHRGRHASFLSWQAASANHVLASARKVVELGMAPTARNVSRRAKVPYDEACEFLAILEPEPR